MRIRTKNSRGSGGMKHKGGTSAAAGTWAIESLWEKMESRMRDTEETNPRMLRAVFYEGAGYTLNFGQKTVPIGLYGRKLWRFEVHRTGNRQVRGPGPMVRGVSSAGPPYKSNSMSENSNFE